MLELYTYNAGKGDCIRLRFGSTSFHNVFIDTGVRRFGTKFRSILSSIPADESLDALILTHVDEDHIGGVLSTLRLNHDLPFHEVWMNHAAKSTTGNIPLSSIQNDEVYAWLQKLGKQVEPLFAGTEYNIDGGVFKVLLPTSLLSPTSTNMPLARHSDYRVPMRELANTPLTKKDTSINNRNSVVFEFFYEGHKLLFTGDAWAEDILNALGPGKNNYDLVKLPHHGAEGNLSDDWQDYISTNNILICTDGVDHPDKHTIAKLLSWYQPLTIYSPSQWWKNHFFVDDDRDVITDFRYTEGLVIRW